MAVAGSLKYEAVFDEQGVLKGLKNVEKEAKKSSGAMDVATGQMINNLSSMAANGLKSVAMAGINYNASIESYETSFEVMLGSQEQAVAKMQELVELGASTPFEVTQLADATQQLLAYGVASEDTTKYLTQLGDISQGSSDKLGSLILSFGKMQSSQKVTLEYLNIMIEQGFNPLTLIAEKTGESMEDLYDRVSKGGVSVDEVSEAIKTATSEGGQFFGSMVNQSETFNGKVSTLKDNLNTALGEAFQPLFNYIVETVLPNLIKLAEWMTENSEVVTILSIVIGALVAIVITYNVAMAIATAVTTAFSGIMTILTSPITLVVLAIVALIAIIVLLVKNWDKVKETASKVWAGIKGIWEGVSNWFKTKIIDPIIGFFTGMWDKIKKAFSSSWEWIKNLFGNTGSMFKGITEGIAGVFKNAVNWIIGGINKIIAVPFKAINGLLNKIKNIEILGKKPFNGFWKTNPLAVPQIPKLAKGGVVSKSTLANIGEDGAEAIVPLKNNTEWTKQVAKLMVQAQRQEKTYNSNGDIASSYSNLGQNKEYVVNAPIELYLDGEKVYNNQQIIAFRKKIGGKA